MLVTAEALYLIEGAGQVGLGLSWGDGYAHHRALLDSAKSVSDPTQFFDSLVGPCAAHPSNRNFLAVEAYYHVYCVPL